MYFRIKSTCMQTFLPPSVFSFLEDLKENNHREWFQNNKTRYQEQYNYALQFADESLKKDKIFILECIKISPYIVPDIHNSLQLDEDIIKALELSGF